MRVDGVWDERGQVAGVGVGKDGVSRGNTKVTGIRAILHSSSCYAASCRTIKYFLHSYILGVCVWGSDCLSAHISIPSSHLLYLRRNYYDNSAPRSITTADPVSIIFPSDIHHSSIRYPSIPCSIHYSLIRYPSLSDPALISCTTESDHAPIILLYNS